MTRLLLTLILLLLPIFVSGKEYVLIAHNQLPTLTTMEIRAIFLKKMPVINGKRLVPVNLRANDPIRKKFEQRFLHMNFQRLKAFWNKQHYLGKRPPVTLKSQQAVIRFVKKVATGIGYVEREQLENQADPKLYIIYTWSD